MSAKVSLNCRGLGEAYDLCGKVESNNQKKKVTG
jgi:hypothetical protein